MSFFFKKNKKLSQRKKIEQIKHHVCVCVCVYIYIYIYIKFNKSYEIRKKGWGHGGHVDILWWGRE